MSAHKLAKGHLTALNNDVCVHPTYKSSPNACLCETETYLFTAKAKKK